MKYPPYITEEDIKTTQYFFRKIREKQGIEQALIFKKMTLVAAYGQMYRGKINYSEFLGEVRGFLLEWIPRMRNAYSEPFSNFWHINKNQFKDSSSFYIKDRTILNATLEQIENEIIYTLKRRYHSNVNSIYTDICKKIIESYEEK